MLTETSALAHFLRTTGPSTANSTTASPTSSSSTVANTSQPRGKATPVFSRPCSFKGNKVAKAAATPAVTATTATITSNVQIAKHIPLLAHYQPTKQQEPSWVQYNKQSCVDVYAGDLPQPSISRTFSDDNQQQQRLPSRKEEPKTKPVYCCHCKSPSSSSTSKQTRRMSCPGAIHYSPAVSTQLTSKEAKALLGMIEQLQAKLAQEQASRRALELALENQE